MNLTRDNEFVRESMMSLTNQFKRYENYTNVMMSIKKEISSLSLQLLQKDSSGNTAQVHALLIHTNSGSLPGLGESLSGVQQGSRHTVQLDEACRVQYLE